MFKKFFTAFTVAIVMLAATGCTSNDEKKEVLLSEAAVEACGRECLSGFITKYLDAMISGKPESLPVESNVKFTEDCIEKRPGEGLWEDITGLTDYRRDILDVKDGVAVSFLLVEVEESPVMYAVRLKVEDRKITEMETMAVRNREEGMLFQPENLQTVTETMLYVPTEQKRNSREELKKIALTYPEGLRVGSFVKVDSPMAPDAFRYENGQLMAGPDCTFFQGCDNMREQFIPTLAGTTHRIIAVDEEMGVVAMRMNFGPGSLFQGDGELDVWHSFKIYDGLMHAAEAYCKVVPAGTPSGWD